MPRDRKERQREQEWNGEIRKGPEGEMAMFTTFFVVMTSPISSYIKT
jgi:hypothetical protein